MDSSILLYQPVRALPSFFRETELFIPFGLGILASVSTVAAGSQADGSVTLCVILNNAAVFQWVLRIQEKMIRELKCESS